jgi:hypothetical protein
MRKAAGWLPFFFSPKVRSLIESGNTRLRENQKCSSLKGMYIRRLQRPEIFATLYSVTPIQEEKIGGSCFVHLVCFVVKVFSFIMLTRS